MDREETTFFREKNRITLLNHLNDVEQDEYEEKSILGSNCHLYVKLCHTFMDKYS